MKFKATEINSERRANAYSRAKEVAGRVNALVADVARQDDAAGDELPKQKDQVVLSNQSTGLVFDSRAYHWRVEYNFANLDQKDGVKFSAKTTEHPRMKNGFFPGFMSAPMPKDVSFNTLQSSEQGTVITTKSDWTKEFVRTDESGQPIEYKKYIAGIRMPV